MIQDRIKNSIFDKQFLVLICLFLISIVPGLNIIGLFIQVLLFISLSLKKDKSNLAVLLFSYSLYGSSVSIYSFKIIKDSKESYKMAVRDEDNNFSITFPITVTDNKYYCGGFELIISDDLKKITIDGKEYGPAE